MTSSRSRSSSVGRRVRKSSISSSPTKPNPVALRVENLTRNVNSDHLREIFGKFGLVVRVEMAVPRAKASAIVAFATQHDADSAKEHLHDGWLDGNKLRVLAEVIKSEARAPSTRRGRRSPSPRPRRRAASPFRGRSRSRSFTRRNRSPFRRRAPSPFRGRRSPPPRGRRRSASPFRRRRSVSRSRSFSSRSRSRSRGRSRSFSSRSSRSSSRSRS